VTNLQIADLSGEPDDESLSRKIYHELRTRIIRGDYAPGTRLRERELAEEFAVSRIPLREALPQLEADGFIETLPRRGAIVTQLTMRDVYELFDVRLGVEVFATRLAAQRVAAGVSPEPLLAAMARADVALDRGDATEIADLNAELHEVIIAFAGNSLLTSMMAGVTGRDRWIFRMTASRDPVLACQEHHQLCDAICAGDADLSAAIAYAHIERGRAPSIRALQGVLPETPEDIAGR
jgi:DNA-binding GntR family transcriptional regulator